MSDLKIGELYLVKQYFWLLYPTKDLAHAFEAGRGSAGVGYGSWVAYQDAKWLSGRFKCNVAVVEENTYFMLLEQDEKFFKVLDSNGNIGWIRCYDVFSNYFELVKAKQ